MICPALLMRGRIIIIRLPKYDYLVVVVVVVCCVGCAGEHIVELRAGELGAGGWGGGGGYLKYCIVCCCLGRC